MEEQSNIVQLLVVFFTGLIMLLLGWFFALAVAFMIPSVWSMFLVSKKIFIGE